MLTDECKLVKLHLLVFDVTKLLNDNQITQLDSFTAALPTFLYTFKTNLIM